MFKLAMLALLSFVSLLVFYMLTALVIWLLFGVLILNEGVDLEAALTATDYTSVTKILNAGQQIGIFLVPALVFSKFVSRKPYTMLRLDQGPSVMTTLSVCVLVYVSSAVTDYIYQLNQAMSLPEALSGLEESMKMLEEEAGEMTKRILAVDTTGGMVINLFAIGLLPALGEELIFRGLVQRFFAEWAKNIHAGIWLAAFAFSFMHMQFYGFFPRLLLGAMFGYLYYWSGNLWVPVVAHFLNNALAVILMYALTKGIIMEGDAEGSEIGLSLFLTSAAFTTFALLAIYLRGKRGMDYQILRGEED